MWFDNYLTCSLHGHRNYTMTTELSFFDGAVYILHHYQRSPDDAGGEMVSISRALCVSYLQ